MRTSLVLFPLVLAACGGSDTTSECDEPGDMPVTVTLVDPNGSPVTGAPVTLDGEACEDNGDGTYGCTAHPDGNWQLSIVDSRYASYAQFLQLPDFACENDPFLVTAQLMAPMGA